MTTIDLRYVDFDYELWALNHMLRIIEPTIDRLSRQDEVDTLKDLQAHGWADDEAEVQLAYQDIREKRDVVLPRFMRGPFVVSLIACFEAGVQAVARGLEAEMAAPIALRELSSESFLAQARRYFEAILGLPLDVDPDRYARLADLYQVRHALAHANGVQEGMSAKQWRRVVATLARHGVDANPHGRGFIVLTEPYVKTAYDDVSSSLGDLLKRARAHGSMPK